MRNIIPSEQYLYHLLNLWIKTFAINKIAFYLFFKKILSSNAVHTTEIEVLNFSCHFSKFLFSKRVKKAMLIINTVLLGNFPFQCTLCVSHFIVIQVNIFLQAVFSTKKICSPFCEYISFKQMILNLIY